jgi:hypothetical protein
MLAGTPDSKDTAAKLQLIREQLWGLTLGEEVRGRKVLTGVQRWHGQLCCGEDTGPHCATLRRL